MAAPRLLGAISDETAIYTLADELAQLYKQKMEQAGVVAHGELRDAADMWVFDWKGETLQLTFRLPEHWYYVEQGRKPTSGTTDKKWDDPIGDIVSWMQVKHVVPRVRQTAKRRATTRPPDPYRQAAAAIVHKIHRQGFYTPNHHGQYLLEEAVNESNIKDSLVGQLVDQFNRAIRVELSEQLVRNTQFQSNG